MHVFRVWLVMEMELFYRDCFRVIVAVQHNGWNGGSLQWRRERNIEENLEGTLKRKIGYKDFTEDMVVMWMVGYLKFMKPTHLMGLRLVIVSMAVVLVLVELNTWEHVLNWLTLKFLPWPKLSSVRNEQSKIAFAKNSDSTCHALSVGKVTRRSLLHFLLFSSISQQVYPVHSAPMQATKEAEVIR